MGTYKLHCFAESGNAYKPALMLALCSADWEPVFVDFFAGAHREGEFLALNPLGEVPVLEQDGDVISQSAVILEYLADQLGEFAPADAAARREALRWLYWDNQKLTGSVAPLRYIRRFTEQGEGPVTAFLEARAKAALKTLDRRLGALPFVTGNEPGIADISICAYLFYGDELGFPLADYRAVQRWLEALRALPGWASAYDLMPAGWT